MAIDIPTIEPTEVTAGDTWTWTKSLPDYLPASWVLSYALVKDDALISFTGSDNGDDTHLISVLAATTATYAPGEYRWQAYATNGAQRVTVGRGLITVKEDFAAQSSGFDGRSSWKETLDNLQAAFAGMSSGEIKTASISHNNRSTTYRSMEELIKAINYAKTQVQAEEAADNLQAGMGSGRRVLVRF